MMVITKNSWHQQGRRDGVLPKKEQPASESELEKGSA